MNKITRRNLQEFCRTCLVYLSDNKRENSPSICLRDIELVTIFRNAFGDDTNTFPQDLCGLCYDKIMNFQEFYEIIHQSTKKIEAILKTSDDLEMETPDDYDNELLLPELATQNWSEHSIKTEPVDMQEMDPTIFSTQQEGASEVLVKNEIDSECEQDESNFPSASCDSFGEDADDEEFFLRSGVANAASSSKHKISDTTSAARKRDRSKKSLKCPRCDKQVYKQVYLDAHIRGVHEGHEKPFLCLECQKAFTRYNQLHVHIQTNHAMAVKFVCDFDGCDATFKMSQTLETHRKVVHTDDKKELKEVITIHQQQLVREFELDHFCNQCGKKYSSKRALSEHLKRHAQIKEHVCKTCGVAKVTRTELKTHMRIHVDNLEKFKCTLCPQEFNHKNAISRHVRVVHEGVRRFNCSFCSRRFGTRNSQVSHERLHTGERPFQCESCMKGFAQIEGLKSHMKNHDKNLRKHVCQYCKQRFITRKNLVDHEQRHFSSKPHICVTCSRGFFKPEDLERHSKQHSDENGDVLKEEYVDVPSKKHSQENCDSLKEHIEENSDDTHS